MKTRRAYTEEFKRKAVRLAIDCSNITAIARDLGISDSVLHRWKTQLDRSPSNPFPGKGNPSDPERVRLEREITRLKEENEILKSCRYIHDPPAVRYKFIQQHERVHTISCLCRALKVSRNGYYAWRIRAMGMR